MTSKGNPAADAAYWNEHLTDPEIDDGEVVEVEVARPLTSTFSLRIPAAELDAIRAEASNAGVSVPEWVRTACTIALSTQENRQIIESLANRAALQQLVRRLYALVKQESNELARLSRLLAS
ncbi:MAG: hypothetical protein M3308_08275 [Actinomycetota bacterium]|nr:hypothetical protein [Actinomycetota bacterium]